MEFAFEIKSVLAPDFDELDIVMLTSVGNLQSNMKYLSRFDSSDWDMLPSSECSPEELRTFIRRKYIERRWYADNASAAPTLATESVDLIEFEDCSCGDVSVNDSSSACESLMDYRRGNISANPRSKFGNEMPTSDPCAPTVFDRSSANGKNLESQDCLGSPMISGKYDDWIPPEFCGFDSDFDEPHDVAPKKTTIRGPECVICLESAPTHVSIPCGHKAYCENCAGKFDEYKDCPICRAPISGMVKVYYI